MDANRKMKTQSSQGYVLISYSIYVKTHMAELNDSSNTLKMMTQRHSDITHFVVFCLEQQNQMLEKCHKNSYKLSLARSLANHSPP